MIDKFFFIAGQGTITESIRAALDSKAAGLSGLKKWELPKPCWNL